MAKAGGKRGPKSSAEQVQNWPPVNANVEPGVLRRMDHCAVDQQESRAEFIRKAIEERVERLERKTA